MGEDGKEPPEQAQHEKVRPEDFFMISDLETLKVITDPLRLNILNLLRGEARTAKDLARALHLSQTRLYYHLGLLEQHGLIRVTGTRLVSGILEKQYQASAYKFSVDRRLFAPTPTTPTRYEGLEAFLSAVLDYTHLDMMRSVLSGLAEFSEDAPPERALHVGRRWLRLTPAEAQAFWKGFATLIDTYERLHANQPDEGTLLYEFLLGFYPTHERSPTAQETFPEPPETPDKETP